MTEIEIEDVGIMRLPNMWQYDRIRAMPPGHNKAIAPAAFGLGMTIRQFKRLPVEKATRGNRGFISPNRAAHSRCPARASPSAHPRRNERVSKERMIELGRELLAIKKRLPTGHFQPWINEKSGISYHAALRFMRAAKEADRQ
ncbi:hypothetical protein KW852_31140 [Ensifer sp. ENS12]|nr:hypothetical protein [Ensifer sp. ENS12]